MSKHIYILSALILLITSCSKENNTPKPDEHDPDISTEEKYEIVNIDFEGKSALIEEVVDVKPNLTYSNNTSSVQKILIDPQPIYEKSKFVPDDGKPYTLIDSTKLISVPLQIDNSDISLGEKKWNYSIQESKSLTNLDFKDSVEVAPKKYLSASLSVIYTRIKTPYTLTIKNVENNDLVHITGVWIGVYPVRTKSLINISDL